MIEKILGAHAGRELIPGDIANVRIDIRAARDFGGANVVKNLIEHGLGVADPSRTFFTFDCNPTGSDQAYAANQQACRVFAREHGIRVMDIQRGIGTHLAIDNGLVGPGSTFVSTDSHANILGAIGAFGQGMGDLDIAQAFARGTVWFEVPPTVRVVFRGTPSPAATAKDLVLAALRHFGANGLLGVAAEFGGPAMDALGLAGRITVSSMATEMGAIIVLFPPSREVIEHCRATGARFEPVLADPDARYEKTAEINVDGLGPLVARPGHPEDVVPVAEVAGRPVDSVFIGSCTNGRFEDFAAAAGILRGRAVAPGVILKIVPATDAVWRRCMAEGLFDVFKDAGALISNAGCAGCAAGQVGQNGPGEVTVSTGNRNFAGKQGKGEVYLASPVTAAASAVAGVITSADVIQGQITYLGRESTQTRTTEAGAKAKGAIKLSVPELRGNKLSVPEIERSERIAGRVWVIDRDNIDTDMVYHNKHLTVTDVAQMGRYAFGNLAGWEHFAQDARPGDIVVTGANFGCGSSRQQAVDCFRSLGIALIIAKSFGAIYERNAINSALPVLVADLIGAGVQSGEQLEADLAAGRIRRANGQVIQGRPFSEVQMQIYRRGGLLAGGK
ncbi:aconitase/3-isopropylmalate dehydratase large subunit family protein [Zavarzinia sp.]|uniref:aconitase/3-isopropylmalate dehydratase large subunit family protein n=1 Tax=Zavarzinia sp. TaxID=2027920 RepID=UPI003562FE1A